MAPGTSARLLILVGLVVWGLLPQRVLAQDLDKELALRLELAAGTSGSAAGAFEVLSQARGASVVEDRVTVQTADPVFADIVWKSMPQEVAALRPGPGGRILLASSRGNPLLLVQEGRVVVAMVVTPALLRWPYFNYMLHAASCAAKGVAPPRYAVWAKSPMPHGTLRSVVALLLVGLWVLALLGYRMARQKGRNLSEVAAEFFAAANRAAPTGLRAEGTEQGKTERIGFTRPLSGFLTLISSMMVLIGPYFALQSLLATKVQPFPEADGLWKTVFDSLWVVWLAFDMGTQTAFVKYFAEHRVQKPEDALSDVQFYVWWQIFSRLVEITLLAALAIGILPWTTYAIYAPFVLVYAACFVPAMGGVGKLLLQGLQRFDYTNLLDLAEGRILCFLIPVPCVLLGRAFGAANPVYGEAFGAAVGLGAGQLLTNVVMLFVGLGCLVRLRLPLSPLFQAGFGRETAYRQLVFGFKLVLSQEPYRVTRFLENLIIVRWLQDSPTWLGLKDLLSGRMIWLYYFSWAFYQSAVPAISEAMGRARIRLMQYYVARYFQYGYLFSFAIFSLLLAVGDMYIKQTLGVQWWRASDYLLLAIVAPLFLPTAWLGDMLQQGAGRPGLNIIVMVIEQGLLLGLLIVLLPTMQFRAIYVAPLVALIVKAVVAWSLNHRYIVPLRLQLWPTLVAPALCGVFNYLLWWGLLHAVKPTGSMAALTYFFVSGAGSFFVCFFFLGLLGGLDPVGQEEMVEAARSSALVGPLTRMLSAVALLGARLSPHKPRPLALYEEVLAEARADDQESSLKPLAGPPFHPSKRG